MSALSSNSIILSRLNSGEYKTTSLPTSLPSTLNPFLDFQTLKSSEIIKEYEKTHYYSEKDKKIDKLYKRALKDHEKIEKNLIKSGGSELNNGEYLGRDLQIKEIEILKFEKFYEIKGIYCEIIEFVKEYEDPYKLQSEKEPIEVELRRCFEEFDDLLRQLRFLDLERHDLLKLRKQLKKQHGVWYTRLFKDKREKSKLQKLNK